MLVKVTDIWYDIEPEDLDYLAEKDDDVSQEDYQNNIADEIDSILSDLPKEMLLEVEDGLLEGELEDDLLDTICDETGWLVMKFDYEIIE